MSQEVGVRMEAVIMTHAGKIQVVTGFGPGKAQEFVKNCRGMAKAEFRIIPALRPEDAFEQLGIVSTPGSGSGSGSKPGFTPYLQTRSAAAC